MTTRRRTRRATVTGTVALASAALAALLPVGATHTAQAARGLTDEGIVCTTSSNPDTHEANVVLTTRTGTITVGDGNSIYMWGYANGNGAFQHPGPVLCVEAGDRISITLKNTLPVYTSIQFPGMEGVQANGLPVGPAMEGGALRSLVDDVAPGSAITYSFMAERPGTFLYESATDPGFQVQMGLFGALVVRPAHAATDDAGLAAAATAALGGDATTASALQADEPRLAFGGHRCTVDEVSDPVVDFCDDAAHTGLLDPATIDPKAVYSALHEYLLVLSEIDPNLHAAAERDGVTSSDGYAQPYKAHYFLINGRTFPDVLAPNGAAWLPSQPYGALAHVEPYQLADGNGLRANPAAALLRYVSAGVTTYPFHPHSNHERIISADAHPLDDATGTDLSEERFAVLVNPGSTLDATFVWTNSEDYADAPGQRVPTPVPGQRNLTEGDFWSGSPYLGQQTQLNPGINAANQCGEYYHVAHSHDLTQATNYGATFGGMLTLIRVDPGTPLGAAENGCGNG